MPILKADDTLPKVARYEDNHISQNPTLFHSKPGSRITFYHHRTSKRSVAEESEEVVPKEEVCMYVVLHFWLDNHCSGVAQCAKTREKVHFGWRQGALFTSKSKKCQ